METNGEFSTTKNFTRRAEKRYRLEDSPRLTFSKQSVLNQAVASARALVEKRIMVDIGYDQITSLSQKLVVEREMANKKDLIESVTKRLFASRVDQELQSTPVQ